MDGGLTTSQLPLDVYQNTLLRRRNSISQSVAVVTTCLDDLHQQTLSSSDASSSGMLSSSSSSASSSSSSSTSTSSASSGEFDLISVKPVSYVSLRDLLPTPAAVNSPKPKSAAQNHLHPGSEISIRNRLVKQAAWAYLQPMSTAPDTSTRNILHRLWTNSPPRTQLLLSSASSIAMSLAHSIASLIGSFVPFASEAPDSNRLQAVCPL